MLKNIMKVNENDLVRFKDKIYLITIDSERYIDLVTRLVESIKVVTGMDENGNIIVFEDNDQVQVIA